MYTNRRDLSPLRRRRAELSRFFRVFRAFRGPIFFAVVDRGLAILEKSSITFRDHGLDLGYDREGDGLGVLGADVETDRGMELLERRGVHVVTGGGEVGENSRRTCLWAECTDV